MSNRPPMAEEQVEKLYRACESLAEASGERIDAAGLSRLAREVERLESLVLKAKSNLAATRKFAVQAYKVLKVIRTWDDAHDAAAEVDFIAVFDAVLHGLGLERVGPPKDLAAEIPDDLAASLRREHLKVALQQGKVSLTDGLFFRLRSVAGAEDGTPQAVLEGLREVGSEGSFQVVPECVIRLKPFLEHVMSVVAAAGRKARSDFSRNIARAAVSAVRSTYDGCSIEELNGNLAIPGIRILEDAYEALDVSDESGLRGQILEFYASTRRHRSRHEVTHALRRLAKACMDDIQVAYSGDVLRTEPGRELEAFVEAVRSMRDVGAATSLGRLLASLWEDCAAGRFDTPESEDRIERLIERGTRGLDEYFDCAFVAEEKAESDYEQPFYQTEFITEFSPGSHPGFPRGAYLRLLSPGIRLRRENRYLVAPRILVSRGEKNAAHLFIEDARQRTFTSKQDREALEEYLAAAWDRAFEVAEEPERLRACVFEALRPRFASLTAESQAWICEAFSTRFGAEFIAPRPGEAVRGADLSAELPVGYEIEWAGAGDDMERGTILALRHPGLRTHDGAWLFPVAVTLAEGPPRVHPFLRDLHRAELPEDSRVRPFVERLLAGTTSRSVRLRQEGSEPDAVLGDAMALHSVALEDGVAAAGVDPGAVERFLTDHGCRMFPTPRALLTPDHLKGDPGDYRISYEFDENLGAGRIVRVVEPGWTCRDTVVRPATIVVSRGVHPVLKRVAESALEIADRVGESATHVASQLREVLAQHILPRLGMPLVLEGADRHAIARELREGALDLLEPLEALWELLDVDTPQASALESLLDRDLATLLLEAGVELRPGAGSTSVEDVTDFDVTVEYSSRVSPDGLVRVRRRAAVTRIEGGAREVLRRGNVVLSAGRLPEHLLAIRELTRAAGEQLEADFSELAEIATARESAPDSVQPATDVDLALAFARALDRIDAVPSEAPGASGEVWEKVRTVHASLRSLGIEVEPVQADAQLEDARVRERFAFGPDSVQYGESGPPSTLGRVVAIRKRAVVVDGEVKAVGQVCVGGGLRDPLIHLVSELGRRVPEVSEQSVQVGRALRRSQDETVLRTISEGAADADAAEARVKAVLDLVRQLQARAGPDAPGFRDAWDVGREILDAISTGSSIRLLPGPDDDAPAIRALEMEGDRFESAFSAEPRGSLVVRRFGWRSETEREPFHIVESLGPKPAFLRELEALPGFQRITGGTPSKDLEHWESRIGAVLSEFQGTAIDPGDVDGAVVPALCRIFDILLESTVQSDVQEAYLGFLETRFGVEVFPRSGSRFSPQNDADPEFRGISVAFDGSQPDMVISQVIAPGLRRAGELLRPASITVNRASTTKAVDAVVGMILPVLEAASHGPAAASARDIADLRSRAMAYILLPEAERDSEEGQRRVVRLALQLRITIPPDLQVSTTAGSGTARSIWSLLLSELGEGSGFDPIRLSEPRYVQVVDIAIRVRELVEQFSLRGDAGGRIGEQLSKNLVTDIERYLHAYEQGTLSDRKILTEADECEYIIQVLNALYTTVDLVAFDRQMNQDWLDEVRPVLRKMIQTLELTLAREFKLISVPFEKRNLSDRAVVDSPLTVSATERRPWHTDVNVVRAGYRHAETKDVRQRGIVRIFE